MTDESKVDGLAVAIVDEMERRNEQHRKELEDRVLVDRTPSPIPLVIIVVLMATVFWAAVSEI